MRDLKVNECPECGSTDLGDQWTAGRKLQQFCREMYCDWCGPIRTPEKIPIHSTKLVSVSRHYGFEYEVFDRYGHTMIMSRTFASPIPALSALTKEIEKGKYDKVAGPYTGVLWPSTVKVTGKKFKLKRGVVCQVNA